MINRLSDIFSPFLARDWMALKVGSILFVLAVVLSHSVVMWPYSFWAAVALSVGMNLTYPIQAFSSQTARGTEVFVSAVLITVSLLSLVMTPWLLVVAIFAHGVWDLLKHFRGAGVAFFPWYCVGCVIVDWTWAAVLALMLIVVH